MSEGRSGGHTESGSIRSSRGSTWWEQRHKRREDRECEREEKEFSLGEGLYQTCWTILGASGHRQFEVRDQEVKRLCRLVRDLELEASGRRQRRDQDNRERRDGSVGNQCGGESNQSGSRPCRDRSRSQESRRPRNHSHSRESRQHRDHSRSHEYADRGLDSPKEQRPYNTAMDSMSCALHRAARSPFLNEIERAPMLSKFTWPPFNSYNGKTNSVKHVSHYIHMMSLHTHNNALMCKVCPSSLGPTSLRWFNRLQKSFIHSFVKLIQEFSARFITCSPVLQSVDALLSLKMRVGETLRSYASRY